MRHFRRQQKLKADPYIADDAPDQANGVAKCFCGANFGACAVRILGEAGPILADHFANLLVLNVPIRPLKFYGSCKEIDSMCLGFF
jgi:hypothetical protein